MVFCLGLFPLKIFNDHTLIEFTTTIVHQSNNGDPTLALCSLFDRSLKDHPYITSAKDLILWVQKMAVFTDVWYCIYADMVDGSEKVYKCADVI